MDIRRATPADREVLLDVWLRSVRATHSFVSAADVESMIPQVRDYLAGGETELWVACEDEGTTLAGTVIGFMGMSGSEIEALFIAPEFQRRGAGLRLVRHARELRGELTVDVNEQNEAARAFYEWCGFVVEGRSELDRQGRPYPLLHMRSAAGKVPRDGRSKGAARDRGRTLDELDPPAWGEPTYDSLLVETCHRLRKKPLIDFTVEDLRILIGQEIGLRWLVPIALERLEEDPLVEGDFYPGDLLSSVLRIGPDFWSREPESRARMEALLARIPEVPTELREPIAEFRGGTP